MKFHAPSYYSSFFCPPGGCADTCCACWEVVIDEESRARYEALPGELGKRLRAQLRRDADGDSYLALVNGACPMLRSDGLCELQKTLGENMLSNVCARYPRFSYSFGALTEEGISLSCPVACELIMTQPFSIIETQTDALPEPNDIDPMLYLALLRGRETAFSIARDPDFAVAERIALLLAFSEALSADIDAAVGLCAAWNESATRKAALEAVSPKRRTDFNKLTAVFAAMEPLSPRFPALLSSLTHGAPIADEALAERLLLYYIYKYFLQSAYDGKILRRVQYIAASMLMHGALLAAHPSAQRSEQVALLQRYARETEHSEQNMAQFFRFAGPRRQKFFYALLLKP